MDRVRPKSPLYMREKSISSFKRSQHYDAKTAAQKLAQVMAHQRADDEDDDGDVLSLDYVVTSGVGLSAGKGGRSPSPQLARNHADPSSTVRVPSVGRPSLRPVKIPPVIPPSGLVVRLPEHPTPVTDAAVDNQKDKRRPTNLTNPSGRVLGSQLDASALQDELDMLQEENENLLDKLRLVEERYEEAEARRKQLEKQVATLGEGVSLEARLLTRKEAALQAREAALRAAAQNKDIKNKEIATTRIEMEQARDEAQYAAEQLREAENEVKALRSMTQRMILTQEEMEEVVLKRCWLAWYWSLCVRHDIHVDIAKPRREHWSSLAPHPFEVMVAAGQKAKEDSWKGNNDGLKRDDFARDTNDSTGEGNIESMLVVEKGLKELATLKIEDAVAVAMGQHRYASLTQTSQSASDPKPSLESQNHPESIELSQEESEDVLFKQVWLDKFL
ncbi:coiled-coil domain-containing protein SCD2-like isoform X2 [Nymphaea colorata]|uniref:coiled-coil domain-containing protein SCD2-like isoform X2 n=1 Tax=Nymphaea colorata TaxID=210225 RepID=UPI00129D6174|nr:coiled-coil domain-containing protein SCD2-like isoform X2 [Nymphaea colorata]